MHVDGFRFDLAAALARELYDVDRLGSFFDTIGQDPVLSQVKLIAEPWDLGSGGYQVGNFPSGWNEWNDKYRDTMRGYWKGDGGLIGDFAQRFMGSSDLYEASGRKPHASVNFVTAHDGFTLHDLVSYNQKHNEANGEDNRDGNDNNLSWNCGVEGPSEDPAINTLRERQKRNLIVSLFLSQGVPMLLAGDEIGHSQQGNNNAYCQDDEISWINWQLKPNDVALYEFVAEVIRLRREHPVFSRRRYLQDQTTVSEDAKEVRWLTPAATEMTETEWRQDFARCLGIYLAGTAIRRIDRRGRSVKDRNFLLLCNAHHEPIPFKLPPLAASTWSTVLDTALDLDPFRSQRYAGSVTYPLQGRSAVLLVESALG
jgi:isoamylase